MNRRNILILVWWTTSATQCFKISTVTTKSLGSTPKMPEATIWYRVSCIKLLSSNPDFLRTILKLPYHILLGVPNWHFQTLFVPIHNLQTGFLNHNSRPVILFLLLVLIYEGLRLPQTLKKLLDPLSPLILLGPFKDHWLQCLSQNWPDWGPPNSYRL